MIVDAGLAFPDEDMLGIDIVLPDFTYLLERKDDIRGLIVTHGHEDHIGGLPYLLKEIQVPIYGTRLTLGLIDSKLEEHDLELGNLARVIASGDSVTIGPFHLGFFRANHSIAEGLGFFAETAAGTVVHTGDFKFDHTPVDEGIPEFGRLAALGDRGVLALLCDSTNAEKPGYTASERSVGQVLDDVFREAPRRVLVTCFASHLHRIQQVIQVARKHRRRVAVVGRSMLRTLDVAMKLGYVDMPPDTWIGAEEIREHPPDRVAVLTTGTQGEPLSALTRISNDDHPLVKVMPSDTVVFAATPVPGNEKLVNRIIDNLHRLGATVVQGREAGVHVSGHASQEELKLMLGLVRPKYLIPIHGEYRHMVAMGNLAREMGMSPDQVLVGENGEIFRFCDGFGQVQGSVQSGRVMVDGLGVGDVGNVVLRDRRHLSQHGTVVVAVSIDAECNIRQGPEIISRGFVYARESEDLLEEACERVVRAVARKKKIKDKTMLKTVIRDTLANCFYEKTRRKPLIIPVVLEQDGKRD